MAEDDTTHKLELRIQKLESRILYGGAAIVAVATVFGISGIKTMTDARTALMAEIDSISEGEISTAITEMKTRIEEQAVEANTHFEAVKAVRASLCADPGSVETYGFCFYSLRAPNGHYAFNYGAAHAACAVQGARLCTLAEFRAAHDKGYSYCAFGWVADLKTADHPRGDPTYGQTGTVAMSALSGGQTCNNGLVEHGEQNIITQGANAYCCMDNQPEE